MLIWNLKYLRGFKWRHLNEKLAYDRRMRETRLNAEMAKATRENNAYVEHVEQENQDRRGTTPPAILGAEGELLREEKEEGRVQRIRRAKAVHIPVVHQVHEVEDREPATCTSKTAQTERTPQMHKIEDSQCRAKASGAEARETRAKAPEAAQAE